jgi:hypothetical protein
MRTGIIAYSNPAHSSAKSRSIAARTMALIVLSIPRSSDGVAAYANLGPKENGVRSEMTVKGRGFGRSEWCRVFAVIPLLYEPKGDEKSFAGNPAGSTLYSQPAGSRL